MSDRIATNLARLFERHRIVFWYDAKQELRKEYEALQLDGVEKVELRNNEFGLKYRMLREEPEQKFLLYKDGPAPENLENWLLDVQLAHAEFRADQSGLWLSEYELGMELAGIVSEHPAFHQAVKRREALKQLIAADDTVGAIRMKMLAVCVGADARLDHVLETLLDELASRQDEKLKLIARCNLLDFLWDQMQRHFGYRSQAPGLEDFAIELFKSCYALGTDGEVKLNSDALVFLKRWKDSRRFETSFEKLSDEYASILGIEQDLNGRDYRTLLELDYFRIIDKKILDEVVDLVRQRTISAGDCTLICRQRRQGHWYGQYANIYEAVDAASQFMFALEAANLEIKSFQQGIEGYSRHWFKIDQLYRRFLYHARKSGEASLLAGLQDVVENLYTNTYLLKLNNRWQEWVDTASSWPPPGALFQRTFFDHWIRPFLDNQKKVFVIVSDALRYEAGEELWAMIRQEDRYEAELQPMITTLPSFTQLGMAALLPHHELALQPDTDTTQVLVDGSSAAGTANRCKILDADSRWKGKAITAEEFLAMPKDGDDGYRALARNHDVVYVYHNRIDEAGDKKQSESKVFEAVRSALEELVTIIRKLSNANANNMIVTADHGFIYQNRELDESDFSVGEVHGDHIRHRDRRFVLGRGLKEDASFKKFTAAAVGLTGADELLIPKSINRLRLKGSGSRYVHGGATLQEIIIPVIAVNKKRHSDLRQVEVQILPVGSSVITAGQLSVAFYQTEPVSEKVQARLLKAGIYAESGELLSDCQEIQCDLTSENPRERELRYRFILTRDADAFNGQDVVLRLTEQVRQTTHPKEYKSVRFALRRSFTTDFDL